MRSICSKRILSLLLVLVMVLALVPASFAADAAKSDDIIVLYTNDVHCGVDAGSPEGSMGYANLAAYKNAMEETHEVVRLVDAGDAIQGEAIGTLSNGQYLIDIMNEIGYDYMTFGNHEFDFGIETALDLPNQFAGKMLCCNFMDLKTGKTVVDAYAIESYGDLDVAYVGICTPETLTKSTPVYFQDENGEYIYGFCEDETGEALYAAVQTAIDSAKAEGADLIVAIGHCGVDEQSAPWQSTDIIQNTAGIDVFLDGHSHTVIQEDQVEDKNGDVVLLSSTGTKLLTFGQLTITPEGEVSTQLISDYYEVDPDVDAFVKELQAEHEQKLQEVVAKTEVPLITMDPDTGLRIIRHLETNLGDLCADAFRETTGADIGLMNGGGIRAEIPVGEITYGDIIKVFPWGNSVCLMEATGQEILDALEMTARSAPGENGGFLQVSGLKYTINPYVESSVVVDDKKMFVEVAGDRRVTDVQVLKDGVYTPIDPEATYTVSSHEYMLKNGGDGVNMFMDNKIIHDEIAIDNQMLINYIKDNLGGVVGEEYSNLFGNGRITYQDLPADVTPGSWYYDHVAYVYAHKLMNGMSTYTFGPHFNITRAQLATVLYRLADCPAYEAGEGFTDVDEDDWFKTAVEWAASSEIVNGYPDGSFLPNKFATREEVMTMFFRFAKYMEYDVSNTEDLSDFVDAEKVQDYALEAMQWAVATGMIEGMGHDNIAPRANMERVQLATILHRFTDSTVTVNLMATSDIHGQFYATDYTLGYESSGKHHYGITRVATFVNEQRALYEHNFLVDCGDLIQGTPLTYYYSFNKPDVDDPAMKSLRMMDYDMFVPGNHEFNYGIKILQRQLDYLESAATEGEDSVLISAANYLDADKQNGETTDWATWNNYKPYEIYNYDGLKIAVIGLGNPNIPNWDVPANWEGIAFAGVIDTYRHYEQEMLDQADLIVVATHSGIDSDPESDFIRQLVNETSSIDLVFTGHEHRREINMIENADGKAIPVMSPSTKCAVVSQAIVNYDMISKNFTIDVENVPMAERGEDRVWKPLYEADPVLEAALRPYETATWEEYMLQPIGTASDDFTASGLGAGPSAFVELVNKVQLWGAYDRTGENTPDDPSDDQMAQLSITAPLTSGNAENLIPKGEIVLGDMFTLYRYENWFYQITMTGKEVDTWLECSASKVSLDENGDVVLSDYLTYFDIINGEGFSYVIDPAKAEGDRVTMTYNGKAVEDTDVFTVVINNYRYNGGGKYIEYLNEHGCDFTPNDPDRIIYSTQYDMLQGEDKGQARNLLADYIREAGEIAPEITYEWSILGAN